MVKTKLIAFLFCLAAISSCNCGYRFSWNRYVMDGSRTGVTVPDAGNVPEALGNSDGETYNAPNGTVYKGGSTPEVAKILIDVQPDFVALKEVIAFAPEAMAKSRPESALSNWVADVLCSSVAEHTGKKTDLAITNFGGIRTDIPKGNIMLDDIVSMFPFKNYLCYVAIPGHELRKWFDFMAETAPQCVSGSVRFVISGGRTESLEIGGEPLDDDRIYGLATIDFLLDGGDGLKLARGAKEVIITDIRIKDCMIPAVREYGRTNTPFTYFTDGRVVVK